MFNVIIIKQIKFQKLIIDQNLTNYTPKPFKNQNNNKKSKNIFKAQLKNQKTR